jgi:hypothetical protein
MGKKNMELDDCKSVEIANSRTTGVGNMMTETFEWVSSDNEGKHDCANVRWSEAMSGSRGD